MEERTKKGLETVGMEDGVGDGRWVPSRQVHGMGDGCKMDTREREREENGLEIIVVRRMALAGPKNMEIRFFKFSCKQNFLGKAWVRSYAVSIN